MTYTHIDADALIAEMEQHRLNDTWPEAPEELLEALERQFTGVSDSCEAFERLIARRAETMGMSEQFEPVETARYQDQRDIAARWAAEVVVRLRSDNKHEGGQVLSEISVPYKSLLRYQDIIRDLFDLLIAQEMARRSKPLYHIKALLKRLTAWN